MKSGCVLERLVNPGYQLVTKEQACAANRHRALAVRCLTELIRLSHTPYSRASARPVTSLPASRRRISATCALDSLARE